MLCFHMLEKAPLTIAPGAANLYQKLRKKGISIRKSNDCVFAYYAQEFSHNILHNDNDFTLIKKHL